MIDTSASPTTDRWRGRVILSTALCVVLMLAIVFFVSPSVVQVFNDPGEEHDQAQLQLHAELFKQAVEAQRTGLAYLALSPDVAKVLARPQTLDVSNNNLQQMFNIVVSNHDIVRIVLQNSNGDIVAAQGESVLGISVANYASETDWIKDVVSTKTPYYFKLLGDDEATFSFQLSVPVPAVPATGEASVLGVLSAEVELSKKVLLGLFDEDANAAVRISQGSRSISYGSIQGEQSKELSLTLGYPAVELHYTFDQASISFGKIIESQLGLLLLLGSLIASFIVVAISAFISVKQTKLKRNWREDFKYGWRQAAFVSFLGLSATATITYVIQEVQSSEHRQQLVSESAKSIAKMRNQLAESFGVLRATKGFYDASNHVSRDEFKLFTATFFEAHPSLQSIQWVPVVPKLARLSYEENARADGLPDFKFIDKDSEGRLVIAGEQEVYYPVYYAEPHEANKKVLGLSPTYSPSRDRAIKIARDTGEMHASSPFKIMQDQSTRFSYLVLNPIYQKGSDIGTLAARRDNVIGYVQLVIKVPVLISGVLADSPLDILYDIVDVELSGKETQIYTGHQEQSKLRTPDSILLQEQIDLAGRFWQVNAYAADTPIHWTAWIVLAVGLCVTAFTAWLLTSMSRRGELLERMVDERTTELTMLSSAMFYSSDIIILAEVDPENLNRGKTIVYLNRSFERFTGYQAAEVLGKHPSVLYGRNTNIEQFKDVEKCLESEGSYQGEILNYTKYGQEFWTEANIFAIKNSAGEVTHIGAAQRDISERKASYELQESLLHSLEESNEFNAAVMSSTSHLISVVDTEGIITFHNPAAERTLGYTADEVVGKATPELFMDKDEVSRAAAKLSAERGYEVEPGHSYFVELVKDGRVVKSNWTFICKDGARLPVELTQTTMFDRSGEAIGYVGIMEDISTRKQAEAERETLISRLTESNQELERFAYVCSHDLQDPLRTIGSFSERLQNHMKVALENDEMGKKYFQFISDSATRAQQLVSDILKYSSISSDTSAAEEVDTNELIDIVKENMMQRLEEINGRIIHQELPLMKGNRTQLLQLFQNLINNGIKYQKPDTQPEVQITVKDAGEFWQFTVQDNGIGMKELHCKKIFEVFKRLHGQNRYAGSGVGLSICKKVVERHGGTIWVESEQGSGSSFHFTLLKPGNVDLDNKRGEQVA